MLNFKKILYFCLVVAFLSPFCFALAQETKKSEPNLEHQKIEKEFLSECESIFKTKCIQCHSLERIKQTKKGAVWWTTCILRMSEKPGADLTKDDLWHILYYILRDMPPPGP
jgi:hypothetical protein